MGPFENLSYMHVNKGIYIDVPLEAFWFFAVISDTRPESQQTHLVDNWWKTCDTSPSWDELCLILSFALFR